MIFLFVFIQGFCKYLITKFDDIKDRGVVIGHDARYGSHRLILIGILNFSLKVFSFLRFHNFYCQKS